MLWKFVLILGLVPVLLAVIARQVARLRRDERPVDGAPAAEELARDLLDGAGLAVRVETGGRLALPGGAAGPLRLPVECVGRRDAGSLGVAVQEAGLFLLGRELAAEVAMRRRVLRFGAAGPAFGLLVAVFAGLAMRSAFGWVVAALVLVVGLACAMNLLTTGIELRAAARGVAELRRRCPRLRRDDLERIERAAQAAAWRRALPVSLAWLLP